jgi:hypothetical protein
LLGFLGFVGSIVTAQAQTNHIATTATTPMISAMQLEEWQRIVDTQQSVSGRDPAGHQIGPNVAKRSGLGLNWYPVDIYKQTLCGTLHHFNFYDGYGDEGDWNNFIIPAASHSYLLEDVKPIADPDDLHKCNQPGDCMEAEITPDESFYENRWFPKSAGMSALEGKQICTYGPWVWEEAHGNRPEIHPSELYWWKDDIAAELGTYTLMALQDDSNRFDRSDNYNGTIVRPWSKFPRTAEFKIAFEVVLPPITQNTPILEQVVFEIDELASRNVVTSNDAAARLDSDDGKQHAIQFDGNVVLRVNELQANDDNIGVRFLELTRGTRGGGVGPLSRRVIRGYIAITSKIGLDDRGKEGYHVIRVRSRRVSTQGPIAPLSAARLESIQPSRFIKPVGGSLRFVIVDGQPKLIGDVELRGPDGSVKGMRAGVSALGGGATEIPTVSGPVTIALPALTLAPIFVTVETEAARDAPNDWAAMVKAAGSDAIVPPPSLMTKVTKVNQQRIVVAPFYAPARDGKPSREDDSPFIEELNEALEKKDAARIQGLFGNNQPIPESNWTFSARNLSTGDTIPVRMGDAEANIITARLIPAIEPNAGVIITFPPELADNVLEVTANVEMKDAFKNKGAVSKKVWSHSLTSANKARLSDDAVSTAAGMAGADVARLVGASKIKNLPTTDISNKQPFDRCARMVRLYANKAVEDENVDIGELTRLTALANQCKTRM